MALPALDVMQTDAINLQEVAGWRILLLRLFCKMPIYDCASCQTHDRCGGARRNRVRFCVVENCDAISCDRPVGACGHANTPVSGHAAPVHPDAAAQQRNEGGPPLFPKMLNS